MTPRKSQARTSSTESNSNSNLKFLQPVRNHQFALLEGFSGATHNHGRVTVSAVMNVDRILAESDIIQRFDHGKLGGGQGQRGEFWVAFLLGSGLYAWGCFGLFRCDRIGQAI